MLTHATLTLALAASALALPGAPADDKLHHRQSAASLKLAGQRVICSYPGTTVPAETLSAVRDGLCAGLIFFGENISQSNSSVIKSQIAALNAANPNSNLPLLLTTDQEGGQIRRLPGAPTQSAKQIGQASNPGSAGYDAGVGAATNLKSVGMNMNLAPVLGVYRSSGDFLDQYGRSYSMNASVVSQAGSNFIAGMQQNGVVATAKHFPGLGAAGANQDTDAEPVTLTQNLSAIRSIDEYPYKAAISTVHVDAVMPSWAVYPALDAKYPAGLSSTILQGELRQRLGFTGATVSDAIEAGALQAFGNDEQRAVVAAQAGMDIILASARNASQGPAIARALAAALDAGTLDASAFQAAASRATALRTKIANGST